MPSEIQQANCHIPPGFEHGIRCTLGMCSTTDSNPSGKQPFSALFCLMSITFKSSQINLLVIFNQWLLAMDPITLSIAPYLFFVLYFGLECSFKQWFASAVKLGFFFLTSSLSSLHCSTVLVKAYLSNSGKTYCCYNVEYSSAGSPLQFVIFISPH